MEDSTRLNPKLVDMYLSFFKQEQIEPVQHPDTFEHLELEAFNPEHSHWMLMQIKEGKLSSGTKEHRWFGFVQASLVLFGLMSIAEQRNLTRDVLNGA